MLKNMKTTKNIIVGIAIGVSITSIPTFANTVKSYLLTKVSYPIIVNGEEYVNAELPVLNYEGSTYVPLKAVGDVLGSNVKWNGELGRVEIGEDTAIQNTSNKSDDYTYYKDIIGENQQYIFDYDANGELSLFKKENMNEPILNSIPHEITNGKLYIESSFYKTTLQNYLK